MFSLVMQGIAGFVMSTGSGWKLKMLWEAVQKTPDYSSLNHLDMKNSHLNAL